jgi:thioredoxin-related protein
MRRYLAAWLCGLLFSGITLGVETRDPGSHFFDQTFGDFQEELAHAKEQGKQGILIMFEMDECPFCHRMKQTVLNRADVQDYFKAHFLIFSVDIEGDVEIKDFQGKATTEKEFAFKQHRVRATPVFAFFDLQGEAIRDARFTGATNGPEEFLALGRYVADGKYREMPFAKYKRAQPAP